MPLREKIVEVVTQRSLSVLTLHISPSEGMGKGVLRIRTGRQAGISGKGKTESAVHSIESDWQRLK